MYLQKIINGRNLHIASMGASATFGEMSFLSGSPASATVSAETDVVVYIMEGYFVNILFNLNPAFAGTRRVVLRRVGAVVPRLRTSLGLTRCRAHR